MLSRIDWEIGTSVSKLADLRQLWVGEQAALTDDENRGDVPSAMRRRQLALRVEQAALEMLLSAGICTGCVTCLVDSTFTAGKAFLVTA